MASEISSTAQKVLEERYFIGTETKWEHLTARVAAHFGKDIGEKLEFKGVMDNLDFLPNSPALMNGGTEIQSYSACYVLPVEDSIESIFKYYSDAGLISKSGGGVGANFSNIRSSGSVVNSTDGVASGPISFMVGQDALTEVIKQGGRRRGANMSILMCDHPDIWEFVSAKDEPGKLENFNLSVGITDEFMKGIKGDLPDGVWSDLKYADNVGLWDEIAKRAWESGEPGVLFMDKIEAGNTVPHLGKLEATNPCLHPDTVIETVEGRVKIKDITKPTKVYTMEEDGSLGIRDASASWISKKGSRTLTVEVRSGKSVTLTPNHKAYVRSKGWVEAKNLKVGDELVHLCRARRGAAYSGVKLTTEANRDYRMEHRFIAEGVYGKLNIIEDVHHINGDTYDNHIDNFEVLSHGEHSTLTRLSCSNDHQVRDASGSFISTGVTPKTIIPMPDELQSKLKNSQGALVKSISVGETTDVYDMTVEGTHNMIANFLVVHNCGEQPLLPYESCTLGSINLSNHVVTYEDHKIQDEVTEVHWSKLMETVHTGVLFLNRILDASTMPTKECQEAMQKTRKIGLGIMGLADMLIQLGLPYDSEEGRKLAGEVMKFIAEEADNFSRELGDAEGYYNGWMGGYVDSYGPSRRNACLTTIAPTGTLSLISSCSSGCEPVYSPVHTKTVMEGTEFTIVCPPLLSMARQLQGEDGSAEAYDGEITEGVRKKYIDQVLAENPELFKGAEDIHWSDHIKMQAVLQNSGVDSSISKTINMPNNATVEDVKDAYELAWKLGCKGVTIFRDGSRGGEQVLSTSKESSGGMQRKGGPLRASDDYIQTKATLPDTLGATRYRVQVKKQKVYVIIAEDNSGHPVEVFAKFPFEGGGSWNTLCRSISLSLRYGVPLDEVISQLEKSVVVVNDMPSHLSRILKMYLDSKGELISDSCPDCGSTLIFEEGCEHCGSCGYSKCG